MGVGRRLREILPYSHGDAQKHGHESVNNSDAQKPSIDIRHIPAFPFTNRDSAEFNLARFQHAPVMPDEDTAHLALRTADQLRTDIANLECGQEFLMQQINRLPTAQDLW